MKSAMLALCVTAMLLAPRLHAQPLPPPQREIPPAFGPHVGLKPADFAEARSFKSTNRIVGTYYFYWYCSDTKEHIVNHNGTDALTDHPVSLEGFSYRSADWHRKELLDMIDAGIDVVLPVFWGAPSEHEANAGLHWSYAGLPPLVRAREQLLREGKQPPRLGLFYDTSTLQHNRWGYHADLTTDYGKKWFYATIRDFFSLVPPRHWAMIDDQPIVLLYAAAFAKKHDQGVIDYAKAQFPKEFGGRVPWIAREISWRVKADDTVAWGGALGLKNPGVASVGPGYDHSAVPGRTPLIVPREGGQFYENNWLRLLLRPPRFAMVETWNEFHEGTDVCASREYGRQYIQLTRKYADLFRSGWKPPRPPGKYAEAKAVSITLGARNDEQGLRQIENEDGQTVAASPANREGRAIKRLPQHGSYIYFSVDDSFKWAERMQAVVEIEYYDDSSGTLALEFDGSDATAPFDGAYSRSADLVQLGGSKTWKTAAFRLEQARFVNSQNRGADFRLAVSAPSLVVRKITLRRP